MLDRVWVWPDLEIRDGQLIPRSPQTDLQSDPLGLMTDEIPWLPSWTLLFVLVRLGAHVLHPSTLSNTLTWCLGRYRS